MSATNQRWQKRLTLSFLLLVLAVQPAATGATSMATLWARVTDSKTSKPIAFAIAEIYGLVNDQKRVVGVADEVDGSVPFAPVLYAECE